MKTKRNANDLWPFFRLSFTYTLILVFPVCELGCFLGIFSEKRRRVVRKSYWVLLPSEIPASCDDTPNHCSNMHGRPPLFCFLIEFSKWPNLVAQGTYFYVRWEFSDCSYNIRVPLKVGIMNFWRRNFYLPYKYFSEFPFWSFLERFKNNLFRCQYGRKRRNMYNSCLYGFAFCFLNLVWFAHSCMIETLNLTGESVCTHPISQFASDWLLLTLVRPRHFIH